MTRSVRPTIYLVLTDDWELRGNGSGSVFEMQVKPMRELVRLFNAHRVRASFNAEVMQQINFRKWQERCPELRDMADAWQDAVLESYRQGHDIQLHLHPQWTDAEYDGQCWLLRGDWSLLNHPKEEVRQLLAQGKALLEDLLRPVDPAYRCVSFRAGAWCIAPSPHLLTLLAEAGIVLDISIAKGVRFHTKNLELDLRGAEEGFMPFYPEPNDARRVARQPGAVVAVPTFTFRERRSRIMHYHLSRLRGQLRVGQKQAPVAAAPPSSDGDGYAKEVGEWYDPASSSRLHRARVAWEAYTRGGLHISDLSVLDVSLLQEMLDSIRKRARDSGLQDVPVVLANHTKDLRDFSQIARFVEEIAAAPDLRTITLTELAAGFQSGKFAVRTRRSLAMAAAANPN